MCARSLSSWFVACSSKPSCLRIEHGKFLSVALKHRHHFHTVPRNASLELPRRTNCSSIPGISRVLTLPACHATRCVPRRSASNRSSSSTPFTNSSFKPIASKKQYFDYFVVVDFEATCERNVVIEPQEIIEFPALKVDATTFEICSTFHEYVRPVYNPALSRFCTSLTGIVQETVDDAKTFDVVLPRFEQWLESEQLLLPSTRFAIVTAGDWDLKEMFPKQLRLLNLSMPSYCGKWINCKRSFAEATGHYPRKIALMLESLGEKFVGRQHSGVDDCQNIVRVLRGIAQTGYEFRYTSWHAHASSASEEALKWRRQGQMMVKEQDEAAQRNEKYQSRQPVVYGSSHDPLSRRSVDIANDDSNEVTERRRIPQYINSEKRFASSPTAARAEKPTRISRAERIKALKTALLNDASIKES